jgi:hypothetical protein
VALKSLGKAGVESGPVFAEAAPVVQKASNLAISGEVPTQELSALFGSLEETHGWQRLTELIYNSAGAFNGFDKYGHYGRALVTLSNCLQYQANTQGTSGCSANFNGEFAGEGGETQAAAARGLLALLRETEAAQAGGGTTAGAQQSNGLGTAKSTEGTAPVERGNGAGEPELGEATTTEGTEPLLDYLLGQ